MSFKKALLFGAHLGLIALNAFIAAKVPALAPISGPALGAVNAALPSPLPGSPE